MGRENRMFSYNSSSAIIIVPHKLTKHSTISKGHPIILFIRLMKSKRLNYKETSIKMTNPNLKT